MKKTGMEEKSAAMKGMMSHSAAIIY